MIENNELMYWDEIMKHEWLVQKDNAEVFKKNLKLFSKFIVGFDREYHYNEPFLTSFSNDFLLFIKYFCLKFPIVNRIVDILSDVADIRVVFDRYWQYDSHKYEKYSIYENPNYKGVCNDNMCIEFSLMRNARLFKLHREISINSYMKDNNSDFEMLKSDLIGFVQKYTIEKEST